MERPPLDSGGLLLGDVELRLEVQAGDRMGVIVDPFGDPVADVSAPIAGLVGSRRRALHFIQATPRLRCLRLFRGGSFCPMGAH